MQRSTPWEDVQPTGTSCDHGQLLAQVVLTVALFCCSAEEVTYARITALRSLIADKDLQPQLCVGEPSIKGALLLLLLRPLAAGAGEALEAVEVCWPVRLSRVC